MFEINLFSQKYRNVLPYLLLAVTVVVLCVQAGYFYWQRARYDHVVEESQNWLLEESSKLSMSRQIRSYGEQTVQLEKTIQKVRGQRVPLPTVLEQIWTELPAEAEVMTSFTLDEEWLITIQLRNMTIEETAKTLKSLNDLPIVKTAQLLSLETMADLGGPVTLQIQLDATNLEEGAENDD